MDKLKKSQVLSEESSQSLGIPYAQRSFNKTYSASGKAIIVGEHAVVYGSYAVAMPLRGLKVQLKINGVVSEPRHRLKFREQIVSEKVSGIVDDTLEIFEMQDGPKLELSVRSEIPLGAGLGSSAALSVAMIRGLSEACHQRLPDERVAHYANMLERRFHGSPSGLDTHVVSMEAPVLFAKGKGQKTLGANSIRGDWKFALIDSGVRSSTNQMISVAAPYFQGLRGHGRIEVFNQLAEQVVEGLGTHDPLKVADAMTEAGTRLGKAGVVPPVIQEIVDHCLDIGVYSAKVTGAGGGGCVLALLDPMIYKSQLERLAERFGSDKVFGVEL